MLTFYLPPPFTLVWLLFSFYSTVLWLEPVQRCTTVTFTFSTTTLALKFVSSTPWYLQWLILVANLTYLEEGPQLKGPSTVPSWPVDMSVAILLMGNRCLKTQPTVSSTIPTESGSGCESGNKSVSSICPWFLSHVLALSSHPDFS